jgi:type VI secretion system protein ImpF
MARVDPKQGLMASILDRLIDPASAGTEEQRGYNLGQMMEAVRKDLEELLNTRQTLDPAGRTRERIRNSILGYGLPDFSAVPVTTVQQRQEIAHALAATIVRYEPRLRDVRVIPLEAGGEKHAMLRFRIEARLTVEPGPEVTFDTVTEEAGQYSVQHASKPGES